MLKSTNQRCNNNAVQSYIGTAYDDVRNIAENLDDLLALYEILKEARAYVVLTDSYGTLSQEDVESFQMAIVRGRAEDLDGGAGLFYYDPDISSSERNDGTILPARYDFSGSWVRIYDVANYSLNWFGAKHDSVHSLQKDYGTMGASVYITDPVEGGWFEYTGSANEDAYNGWVRTSKKLGDIPDKTLVVQKDSDKGAAYIPSGRTTERPVAQGLPALFRFNENNRVFEGWDGNMWVPFESNGGNVVPYHYPRQISLDGQRTFNVPSVTSDGSTLWVFVQGQFQSFENYGFNESASTITFNDVEGLDEGDIVEVMCYKPVLEPTIHFDARTPIVMDTQIAEFNQTVFNTPPEATEEDALIVHKNNAYMQQEDYVFDGLGKTITMVTPCNPDDEINVTYYIPHLIMESTPSTTEIVFYSLDTLKAGLPINNVPIELKEGNVCKALETPQGMATYRIWNKNNWEGGNTEPDGINNHYLNDTSLVAEKQSIDARSFLFKNDEFGSAVENMVAGRVDGVSQVEHTVGDIYIANNNTYEVISLPVTSINNFKAINPIYRIDFRDWNVTENTDVDRMPPYTNEEYDTAYQNGENLTAAIAFARDSECTEIIFPKGRYIDFCYEGYDTAAAQSVLGCIEFEGLRAMDIDLNDCVLYVLFDSINRSPYDFSVSAVPHQLDGNIIYIKDCQRLTVTNGELIGDMYKRDHTYDLPLQAWVEQTYGVYMAHSEKNHALTFENVVAHGFAGDGFQGSRTGTSATAVNEIFNKGDIVNGNITVTDGFYYSDLTSIVTALEGGRTFRIGAQSVFTDPNLKVVFYDDSATYIMDIITTFAVSIYTPINATQIRLVARNELDITDTLDFPGVRLRNAGYNYLTFKNCETYNNNRGGFANLSDNTVIENCKVGYTAEGTRNDWFLFPDSTRYTVNSEDFVVDNITIKDSTFGDGVLNPLLFNTANLHLSNITVNGIGGIGLYKTSNAVIDDVRFYGESGSGIFSFINPNYPVRRQVVKISKVSSQKGSNGFHTQGMDFDTYNGDVSISDSTLDGLDARYASIKDVTVECTTDQYKQSLILPMLVHKTLTVSDVYFTRHKSPALANGYRVVGLFGNYRGNNIVIDTSDTATSIYETPLISVGTMSNVSITAPDYTIKPQSSGMFALDWKALNSILDTRVIINRNNQNTMNTLLTSFKWNACTFMRDFRVTLHGGIDNGSDGDNILLFQDCTMVVDDITSFILLYAGNYKDYTITFINCKFVHIGESNKDFNIVNDFSTKFSSRAVGCDFINCTNIDGVTVIS